MELKRQFCAGGVSIALWLASIANADDFLFDADQWGDANLKLRQSVDHTIESVLRGNPNFEPLATYQPNTRVRRLSRPVGRLDIRFSNGQFTTCTATLIAEDLLLTNHHCVPGTGKYGPVVEAELLMGYYSNIDIDQINRYKVTPNPINSNQELDYALLEAQGSPGNDWGWAILRAEDPQRGDSLIVIHHPGGKVKHITRGGCQAGPTKESELFHKCDTLPGSSGAPIISDDSEAVVALHYAGERAPGPDSYNYGKLISWIESSAPTVIKHPVVSGAHTGSESMVNKPSRWEKTFAERYNGVGTRLSNGDYLVAANNSANLNSNDLWAARISVDGVIRWEKDYVFKEKSWSWSKFESVIPLPNERALAVLSFCKEAGKGCDQGVRLLTLDENGDFMRDRTLNLNGRSTSVTGAIKVSDSAILLTGSKDEQPWIARVTKQGELAWEQVLRYSECRVGYPCYALAPMRLEDGLFAVAIDSYSKTTIFKVESASGRVEPLWNLGTQTIRQDAYVSVLSRFQGYGYVSAGAVDYEHQRRTDAWITVFDEKGNERWSEVLGGPGDDRIADVVETEGGGLLAFGETGYLGDPTTGDLWFIEFDADGTILRSNKFGHENYETAAKITKIDSDDYYILVPLAFGSDPREMVVRLLRTGRDVAN